MKKVFKIKYLTGEYMGERSILGVEIKGNTLSVTTLKGINITQEAFFIVVGEYLDDIMAEIADEYNRVSPYKIRIRNGMSGCVTWSIMYLQKIRNFWVERCKDIIHISMYQKIPTQDIFIPDLSLVWDDIIEHACEDFKPSKDDYSISEIDMISHLDGYIIPDGYYEGLWE